MEITVQDLPNSEQKITVKLSQNKHNELKNDTLKKLSKNVKVAGFRPGHAPLDVVESQIGKETVFAVMLENSIPTLYTQAIKDKKLTPISRPNVDVVAEEPLEFTAVFAVQPEVKIKDLDKIKIKAPKTEVSEKELKEALEYIQTSHASYKEVTRKAKKGDRVELNFEGIDEKGNPVPGAKSENHPLVIGSGNFIPGFEDNLIGLELDQDSEFTVTFPKDYHAKELADKPVTFKVKITKIEEVEKPKIDKELSKKIFNEELEEKEFKAKLKHEIEHQKIHELQAKQEDDLFTELLKKADFTVSDILIEEEVEILLNELKQDIQKKGLNYDDFVKMNEDKEKKSINEIYKPKAEERAKIRFIIDFVIREKKLEATDQEIQTEVDLKISTAPEQVRNQVVSYYEEGKPGRNALRNKVLLDKFFALFLEKIDHKH